MSKIKWENAIRNAEAADNAADRESWVNLARELRIETKWEWESGALQNKRTSKTKAAQREADAAVRGTRPRTRRADWG